MIRPERIPHGSPPTETFRDVELPSGARLPRVEQAYRLLGAPRPDGSNLVLLFHSLTGGIDPAQWWPDLVRPGGTLDPARRALLVPALLGSCNGTRAGGPEVPPRPGAEPSDPGAVPADLSPRDMVHLVGLLLDRLGLPRVRLAAGGSLGGMAALEWAASFPERSDAVVVFAAPAAHPAQAVAFNRLQRRALRLGGPAEGLALARQIAMLTYRTAEELDLRFGRERRGDGLFQVTSWLEHHGRKLVERFHPRSYGLLLDAMDAHDVGAGRGSAAAALRRFRGRLYGVGIRGDLLYPPGDVEAWVEAAGAEYREIRSVHGHDAFLLEQPQVGRIFEEAFAAAEGASFRAAAAAFREGGS